MWLLGIIEAQIEDGDQGFMEATTCRVIFLLKLPGAQVQWKDSRAGELKILTGEWLKWYIMW